MREAVDRGADGVELDVHRTADGGLGVRHDAETPDATLGERSLRAAGRTPRCRCWPRCWTSAGAGW